MYKKVNPKQSFPKLEEEVLAFWNENKIFEKSVETRKDSEEFNFYDGPPFATGTPHYGHLLAWTLKDVIPRYQTMKGKRVDRVFGWDCHGLPIENIVEKKLEISGRDDIMKVWVHNFNEECRVNVDWYVDVWKQSVNRLGRWVDMENAYKTMDTNFMESVWWVYKELYDKGLIYEGHRVVPYCPRCTTPLSNFEVNQGYKDKQDKTLSVKFKVVWNENKYILAWTTTPWTLMANLWLAVGADIDYVELLDKDNNETYILAKDLVKNYYKQPKNGTGTEDWKNVLQVPVPDTKEYTIIREYPGTCLEWIKYEPIFDDFKIKLEDLKEDLWSSVKLGKNVYSVVIGHHVTTESGTWIVHIAPAYWEDDFIIWEKNDLGFVSHIDDSGNVSNTLSDNWKYVFDYNNDVIEELKKRWDIFKMSTIDHSYPHCWRCDTPLIYRGISAWYVAVEKIRDKMVANNQDINWTPEVIKNGRFGKWVENARDWNISRNRYWGSAIPVWQSEDKKTEVCIGSVKEMYELNKDFGQIEESGGKYFYTNTNKEVDIHKHFVDEIKLKDPKTWVELKRIPEVLDCWFESWAMPYASKHYPFQNKESFKFPADFIAEGLDQTRGWFYTLLILGTALFDKAPMKNVIVNWIILAEDGKKMSKSLKNYPDPTLIFDKYGADALRFYLMNSPVVEAQEFRFSEDWVQEVVKKVILPLWNTFYFYTTYANIDKFEAKSGNIYLVRHGQTDNNKNKIVNGWDDDLDLNETGISQAHELGKQLATQKDLKFEVIITSPMTRTKNTAKILKSYLWYDVKIIEDESFREQSYGEFRWMSHKEIIEKYNCKNKSDLSKVYRNNSEENVINFVKRVEKWYKKLEHQYKSKNILVISHGWVSRAINKYINNLSIDEAFYKVTPVKNSKLYKLPNYKKSNKLDKWIISELNKLILEVSNWFDTYKLNESTRPIVKFMDNLTNWYIRRSRKRFWKSENDWDKIEAYNTLNDILIELSKVISPFMPFTSEHIFKELTGKQSVHLELYPETNPWFIFEELNNDMAQTQNFITLWLSARANEKLRVRQPLSYAKIWANLEDYYKEILKEELNVKEIKVFSLEEMPKKICKPNGRTIWPKFGKDVKFIMTEAKAWNFEELENGWVKVTKPLSWILSPSQEKEATNKEFILEKWDFEIVLESNSDSKNKDEVLESWFGTAVSISTELNSELIAEWLSRDLVRQIQEARKDAEFNVEDRIEISIYGLDKVVSKFKDYIENETLSKIIENIENPKLEKEVEIEWNKIVLTLVK